MGPFASLIESNQVGRVTIAIEKAIVASLKTHPMRHSTDAETRRRFDICARVFKTLRADLKWGIDRILDRLPTYLAWELDEKDWAADARGSRGIWAPGDGG